MLFHMNEQHTCVTSSVCFVWDANPVFPTIIWVQMESSALLFNQPKVWICCKKFSSFFNYLCHSWTIMHLGFGWIYDLMYVCECVNNLNRQLTHFSCWLVPMWLNLRSIFFEWLSTLRILHKNMVFFFFFPSLS